MVFKSQFFSPYTSPSFLLPPFLSNSKMAAGDHPNSNSNPFNANGYALTSNILLTVTLILVFLILLLISLHFYARWYLRRARLRHRQRRRSHLVFYVDSLTPDAPPPIGLDPSVIQSVPVFVYSAHSDPAECAVCLSEFQENESGRVLPKCNHTFHVECIDMWFQSHSTCPLCRSLVETRPTWGPAPTGSGDRCWFEFGVPPGRRRRQPERAEAL
ncbi:RING-H2 finger protein ATL2-like [Prosopis cineraria]|uniref:RING-H2 finger protein ATL2-like n=1 Tax=Prosopis cineraria TaxID=364024 RepID=UPI0024103D20|nr:RING-H2 finger protein ATL2-like [Prosopis cineraria]